MAMLRIAHASSAQEALATTRKPASAQPFATRCKILHECNGRIHNAVKGRCSSKTV